MPGRVVEHRLEQRVEVEIGHCASGGGDHTVSFLPRGGRGAGRRSTSTAPSPRPSTSASFPTSRSGCGGCSTRSWRPRSPPSWSSRAGTPPARGPSSSASPSGSIPAPSASIPGAPPSELEQRYHFLWRYQLRLPEDGHMVALRPLLVRPRPGGPGGEVGQAEGLVGGLRADQRVRALAGRRRPGAGQVLVPHLAEGAAAPPEEDGGGPRGALEGAEGGPGAGTGATTGGWRRSRRCWRAPTPRPARGRWWRRPTSAGRG